MRYYEQIVLPVINDGDGSFCGTTYTERCNVPRLRPYLAAREYTKMCARMADTLGRRGLMDEQPETRDLLLAAADLADYYAEHVKELA